MKESDPLRICYWRRTYEGFRSFFGEFRRHVVLWDLCLWSWPINLMSQASPVLLFMSLRVASRISHIWGKSEVMFPVGHLIISFEDILIYIPESCGGVGWKIFSGLLIISLFNNIDLCCPFVLLEGFLDCSLKKERHFNYLTFFFHYESFKHYCTQVVFNLFYILSTSVFSEINNWSNSPN